MRILIIGAGFAGLGAAIRFKQAGLTAFTIFDRGSGVGGTWRDNTYPGCACDVPSQAYSFSFEPAFDWPRRYAHQAQILAYLQHLTARYQLEPHLRLNTNVVSAQWLAAKQVWQLELGSGEQVEGEVLIQAVGALVKPLWPQIPGQDTFSGPMLHSARWPAQAALEGQRIALIGTGASAIQIGPELAKVAQHLQIFQRTPPWILPRADRAYGPIARALYRHVPLLGRLNRWAVYSVGELITWGFIGQRTIAWGLANVARWQLRRQVQHAALRAQLEPQYTMGCKRVLVSDSWYPMFNQAHVSLVTQPIERITAQGLLTTDGQLCEADTIVFATGFTVSGVLGNTTGREGLNLREAWQDGAKTYLGLSTQGFPNMFMLLGPGTGLGANSLILMLEHQINYIVQALQHLKRHPGTLEIKPEVQARSDAAVQKRMARTVWASGCRSWYQSASGRIDTLWPDLAFNYGRYTRRFQSDFYHHEPRPAQPAPVV